MSEQTQNLKRVRQAIAKYVTDFIDEHEGRTFSNSDLYKFVSDRVDVAPDSPARVLRDLKASGAVCYELISRSRSMYRVPKMGMQRELF